MLSNTTQSNNGAGVNHAGVNHADRLPKTNNGDTPATPKWRGVYAFDDGWESRTGEHLPVGDVDKILEEWGYRPADLEIGDDTTPVSLELYAGDSGDFATVLTIGKKLVIIQASGLPALLSLFRELEPLLRLSGSLTRSVE